MTMENIRKLIDDSALQLVSLEPNDLPALADLHTLFEKINEEARTVKRNIPEAAFYKQMAESASQAAQSIEKIILRESENTQQTLDSINAIAQSLQELAGKIFDSKTLPAATAEAAAADSPSPINHQLPDNVDEQIFREFLANQPFVLENLESAVLAAEKDSSLENRNALKAILHSIKGETGLMGLETLSRQCHEMESLLENSPSSIPAEKLLGFKDSCLQMVNQFRQRGVVLVSSTKSDACVPNAAEKPAEAAPAEAGPAFMADKESFTIAAGDVPLVLDFINESNEHLESAEADLLTLEENPDNLETVNSIFRAFHTIKGVAGFLNLKQIGSLAHATENLLDLSRKGTLALTGPCVDVVFEAIDIAKKMIASLRSAVESSSPVPPYNGLQNLIDRITALRSGQSPPARTGDILVDMKAATRKEVDDAVWQQSQETPEKKIGEILIDQNQASPQQVEQALQIQKERQEKSSAPAASGGSAKAAADSTVKVTTSRLDALINMVGELVIAQAMVSQGLDPSALQDQRLERNLRHLTKITRDLQELSMSMRMVPVQGVFQKMARLIRDLSHKAEKSIDFVMSGSETELDRNVVEAIADPLVHMIRNSIDHGIEPPPERLKAGKSPTGKVELKAYHQGGNIVIEIADDGRGLNKDKILQKAIKNGLVKEGQELSEPDIFRLIFHAGLSTAEKVTDISGRGVGMDVVRKNIESLRGRVDIQSVLGKGTTFRIALPLTLAVIDGQVITIGAQRYIIPTTSIEQNLRPSRDQISSLQGGKADMVMIRGNLLPLIRLYDLFRIESKYQDPCEGLLVVVADGDRRACLLVDSLLGQQQVVIKSLGNYLGTIQGISGSAIMGDGNVSLILDIPGLIKLSTATVSC